MLYGPSAATGLTGGAAAFMMTGGSPLYTALAAFTLIGATLAARRILPKRRRAHRATK